MRNYALYVLSNIRDIVPMQMKVTHDVQIFDGKPQTRLRIATKERCSARPCWIFEEYFVPEKFLDFDPTARHCHAAGIYRNMAVVSDEAMEEALKNPEILDLVKKHGAEMRDKISAALKRASATSKKLNAAEAEKDRLKSNLFENMKWLARLDPNIREEEIVDLWREVLLNEVHRT